ncbi:efflux RND transporter periplasmic adaptor subunit [Siminovitchia sediminis]|uniref:Efflux RND transporter periplasmic adaptor subunit n=1 Tax=Siminovitchia sediminis TaxID=1274353 RepID=A0ABW4KHP5_9BACI
MNKWIRVLMVLGVILFITANTILITRENGSVSRINYISDWSKIRETDIVHSLAADGVIEEADTIYIMADQEKTIEEFLVKEGDQVEAGTTLFIYQSNQVDRQTSFLDSEIESLLAKRNSVEALIDEWSSLTPPASADTFADPVYSGEATDFEEWDPWTALENPQSADPSEWQQTMDKEIGEKRLELEKIEAEIEKLEKQKAFLQNERDDLAVTSPVDGIVKKLRPNEKQVITIASNEKVLTGKLTEEELPEVKEGMRVNILSHLFESRPTGEVSKITRMPAGADDGTSLYPFTVTLDEQHSDVQYGYHVTADIILNEMQGVPVVFAKSIRDQGDQSFIWVLNENGITEKREIEKGLEDGGLYAVTSGGQTGELYVTRPGKTVKEAPFITPLEPHRLNRGALKNITCKQVLKHILIGVLQH